MTLHRNKLFAPAPIFIAIFFLSSCGFAYKPAAGGTTTNKMVYSIPLGGHTIDITAGVANKKDTGAFDVIVWIGPVGPKDSLTIDWLKLSLVGRKRHVQPYALKAISLHKQDNWGRPNLMLSDTAIAGLHLDNATYVLTYHFAGINKMPVGHALRIDVKGSFTQASKTQQIDQAIDFKRFFWFDIAGN